MNRLLLTVLLSAPATHAGMVPANEGAAPAILGHRYVNATVRGSLRDHWDISDFEGKLWLSVSAFANSVNFSGRPISGSMFGGPNSYSISGGTLSGSLSRWGGGMNVSATVFGPHGANRISFQMTASGPANDPNRPPSLSVFSGDASLNFMPGFGSQYSVSGMIDEERFGDEGLALACLAATVFLKDRSAALGGGLPKADWLQKSTLTAPLLKRALPR